MTRPREAQLELLLTISEGLSRGSGEMLRVSPTDAMHAPSCGLAIRDAVEELKWMRAEIERLHNEDTKTRHALKGWVYVPPDGGDEPTHERVAAVVAEVERLERARRWR